MFKIKIKLRRKDTNWVSGLEHRVKYGDKFTTINNSGIIYTIEKNDFITSNVIITWNMDSNSAYSIEAVKVLFDTGQWEIYNDV